jgi:RNA polymerase primary sigma factor
MSEKNHNSGSVKIKSGEKITMTTSQAYIRNITDFSLLSLDEENQLADEIQNSDKESEMYRSAKSKLIRANLRLVVKLAGEFVNRGVSKHDLIAEGNIGLMTAAEKFDPAKGAKFSTYSAWWIKQAMRRAIAEQSRTIRIPVQSIEKIGRINKATRELLGQFGRPPTDEELSLHLEMSRKTIADLRHTSLSTTSLNESTTSGENGEIQDFIPDNTESMPDKILSDTETFDHLKLLVDKLPERERKVLQLRFGLDGSKSLTLEDVGAIVGCTRERVRQIQNNAIKSLQEMHRQLNCITEPTKTNSEK